MNPEYDLPKFEVELPPPPKFIRDGMNISDIDGTKAKQKVYKFLGDKMNVDDIEGTSPKKKLHRSSKHDQEYKDVYQKKEKKRDFPYNP